MNTGKLLYLSKQDIEHIDLPMMDIIGALEDMFHEKGHSRVEMPPQARDSSWA